MSTDLHGFVSDLFPDASPALNRLFWSAIEHAGPLHADFLTVRDLVELSGYRDHESLHALLLILFLALAEGSLCVELSPAGLRRRLTELLEDAEVEAWTQRILADVDGFPDLIGQAADDNKPLLCLRRDDSRHLYFHKYLRAELSFREHLDGRIENANASAKDWQPILHEVLHEQPLLVGSDPVTLDRDQQLALGLALSRNFVIVSGGPGTGKTSLVLTLLRCLVRAGMQPEQIALAAPTGRAAQRLVDALRLGLDRIQGGARGPDLLLHQLGPRTLHRLLDYHSGRGIFRRHAENPLPADVVIVDEVSMVGVVLMAHLLRALRSETKLILLGDKDQLPSVEPGAVLASLVPPSEPNRFAPATWQNLHAMFPGSHFAQTPGCWPDHLVMLQVNHRSQEHIRDTAAAINRQAKDLVETLQPLPDDAATWWHALEQHAGCFFAESTSTQPSELRRLLQHWADLHFLGDFATGIARCDLAPGSEAAAAPELEKLFVAMEANRILTLVREGAWGCVGINAFLDRYLRPRLDRPARGNLFAGAPVLITANDHARELFNGDVGLTVKSRGNLRVIFRRQGGFVSFAAESLPARELGFALTVHKSQGSEYDRVLIVLPPSGGRRLLTKEILYTGVTRARRLAVLCASREALQLAVSRRILRESALGPNVADAGLAATKSRT